jgi:hypothetical protein
MGRWKPPRASRRLSATFTSLSFKDTHTYIHILIHGRFMTMRESLHYNHYIYDPPFTTAFAFFWFRMVLLLVLQFFRLSIVFSTEEEQNRTRGAETGGGEEMALRRIFCKAFSVGVQVHFLF